MLICRTESFTGSTHWPTTFDNPGMGILGAKVSFSSANEGKMFSCQANTSYDRFFEISVSLPDCSHAALSLWVSSGGQTALDCLASSACKECPLGQTSETSGKGWTEKLCWDHYEIYRFLHDSHHRLFQTVLSNPGWEMVGFCSGHSSLARRKENVYKLQELPETHLKKFVFTENHDWNSRACM